MLITPEAQVGTAFNGPFPKRRDPRHTCCRRGRDVHGDHAKERFMNHSQEHAGQGEHPLRYAAI
jgi:hypothetical protein